MSVDVTYSSLRLLFDIPEDMLEKIRETGEEPEIQAFTMPGGYDTYDAKLSVEFEGEEYEINLLIHHPEERDALDTISPDGVNVDIDHIEDVDWEDGWIDFSDAEYSV